MSLLRRYPNNATANTLLGDICAERGDLDQAAEWYDLALDIVSDSDAVRKKLSAVKQRLADREAANTAKQIGLPERGPRTGLVATLVIVAILAVGLTAFLLGRGVQPSSTTMETPIDVSTAATVPPQPTDVPTQPPSSASPWHDATLATTLRQHLPEPQRLLDAWQDPRSRVATLSIKGDPTASQRELAATMGLAAMEYLSTAPIVTVRVVVEGSMVYLADIPREKVIEISSEAWRRSNAPNPKAWIDAVLANEWPAPAAVGEGQ